MPQVQRWIFDQGGSNWYTFARNPDRVGGDTGWTYESKLAQLEVIGSNRSRIQLDGFRSAVRSIRFTALSGAQMRTLQSFYLRGVRIDTCYDHLWNEQFSCFITGFQATFHPTIGNEDLYDVEMSLLRMS